MDGELKIPALGMPFKLGGLYDCRRSSPCIGISLWDKEVVMKNRVQKAHRNVQVEFMSGSQFHDACREFEVDAELSLSVLCGLVSVSGSAEYLNRKQTSRQSEMVSLKYYHTSIFEELEIDDPTSKMKNDVLHDDDYTHVVTGILRGGRAVFLFESGYSQDDANTQKGINLHANVKNIFCSDVGVGAGGGAKQTEENVEKLKHVKCTYYGDIKLVENVTSAQEAVAAYKKLPAMCTDENSVPVTVHLTPLRKYRQHDYIYKQVPQDIAKQLEAILNSFATALADIEILQQQYERVCYFNLGPTADIKCFHKLTVAYVHWFKRHLQEAVICVRKSDDDGPQLLQKLIVQNRKSPYEPANLCSWVEKVTKVLERLHGQFSALTHKRVKITSDLQHEICTNEEVICLIFEAGKFIDHQVYNMNSYSKFMEDDSSEYLPLDKPDGGVGIGVVNTETAEAIQLFLNYVVSNGTREFIQFVVHPRESEEDTESDKCRTSVYKYGKCTDEDFHVPSKPENFKTKKFTKHSVDLKWTKPVHGDTSVRSYRIEWRKLKDPKDSWQKIYTNNAETKHTVANLEAGETYRFRVAGCCKVGRTSNSDELEVTTDRIFRSGVEYTGMEPSDASRNSNPNRY